MNRGTTGVNSLPKTVTRQHHDCDLNADPSAPEPSILTTRLPSHRLRFCIQIGGVASAVIHRLCLLGSARRRETTRHRSSSHHCHRRRASLSNTCIAVRKVATPLRELTCHMGSHSVTCHPAEVTSPPLPQPKLVLD